MDLHWYKVSNGVVSSTADYLGYKDQSALPSLCDQGTTNDCIRGFDQQLNFSNGPVSDRGIDQIQTDEQP